MYDPSDPEINPAQFERRDWTSSEFGHVDGEEELPPNMPEPHMMRFTMRDKVDADHASDTVTRRSRTGFLVYLKCDLVYLWSKKQMSVESSSFSAEFIAMKQCCAYLRRPRYYQKFGILHTSECLMVDVPRLDHLWDGQKDHHSNEKIIWCMRARTTNKPNSMLL